MADSRRSTRWIGLLAGLASLAGTAAAHAQSEFSDRQETTYSDKRSFAIPFDLPEAIRRDVRRLHLYVAEDSRGDWIVAAVAPPDQGVFNVRANRDGSYLYAVQVEYLDGTREPASTRDLVATQRVVVDTVPPTVELRARRGEPGTAGVEWVVTDENLDPSGVRLEGRWPEDREWTPIPGRFAPRGDYFFRMKPGDRYQVRVLARDLAEQVGQSPVVVTPPSAEGGDSGSNRPFVEEPIPPAGMGGGAAPATDPRILDTNNSTVTLEPRIEVGRSGVGKIQLWVTRDQGRTWEEGPSLDNPRGVPEEDPRGTGNPRTSIEKFELTYPAKEDGLYGFIIVAENNVQLGYPGPQRGDPPDILVMVDTKPPTVSITKTDVQPAGDSGNRVIITWNIEDDNLARGKINLFYSPAGVAGQAEQWKEVATSLDNTGRYDWMVGPEQPYQFKLKLVAADRAGNSTEAITAEPVTVDLFKPRTINIGIK